MKKIILNKELENQICEYYLDNHSLRETSSFFNLNRDIILRVLQNNNVNQRTKDKTKLIEIKNRILNCNKKYGVDFYMQTPEYMNKVKKTNKAKYGVEWQILSKQTQDKANKTKLNKYKNISYNNRLDAQKTCLKKYGVSNYISSNDFKGKSALKHQQLYGTNNYFKTSEFKTFYQKNKNTIKNKEYETKRKNGTFNTSKPEDQYYFYLVEKYGANDVIRQYKDKRYPFACDFYIKSKDMFIELNLNWTHGGHKFDPNNESDINRFKEWKIKSESSDYYKNAIKVWTTADPLKFKTAADNDLNYIVYYSIDELYKD